MIGLTNFDWKKHKEILENFFKLAQTGKILPGNSPGHCDGWGIGYYKNGEAVIRKSGKSILREKRKFFDTLEGIAHSHILIVHLRKSAWPETSTTQNAHPFSHKNILFAHNGTIRDYKNLLKEIAESDRPLPSALDSEVYFRYVMSFFSADLEKSFEKAVRHIKKENTYSSLTCLFSNGNKLYGYREYSKHPEYYSLYCAAFGRSKLISSEPVSPPLEWKMIRKGMFISLP